MKRSFLVAAFLLCTATGVLAQHPDDIFWEPVSPGAQPDGGVNAMAVYDGRLIVAGPFENIDSLAVGHIAAWDGSSWSTLGAGLDGPVSAMTVYDAQLIAAGNFTSAGGMAAPGVAAWDGTAWTPLDIAVGNNPPHLLTVYDGHLFAGVHFENAISGELVSYVERWNGTTWVVKGRFEDWQSYPGYAYMWDLSANDDELVAGGWFNVEGTGPQIGPIAVWDGSSWSGRGPTWGMEFSVGYYNGQPICGAWGNVSYWNGSGWSLLGHDDFGYPISPLYDYNGYLIACGQFEEMGGQAAMGIAAFYGTSWWPLGSGVSASNPLVAGEIAALCSYDNALVVGGSFASAGGKSIPYLAQWTKMTPSTAAMGTPMTMRLHQNTPNPFNPTTSIRYVVPSSSRVVLRVYTPSGELVRTLVDTIRPTGVYQATWDGTNSRGVPVASGVYVCSLHVDKQAQSIKMILLK